MTIDDLEAGLMITIFLAAMYAIFRAKILKSEHGENNATDNTE